jgi:hypothetical protein
MQTDQATQCEATVTLAEGIHAIRSMGLTKDLGIKFANSQTEALTTELSNLHSENVSLKTEVSNELKENASIKAEVANLLTDNASLKSENVALLISLSWRITTVIRLSYTFLKEAKRLILKA